MHDEAKVAAQRRGARNAEQILKTRQVDPVAREQADGVIVLVEMEAQNLHDGDEELQRDVEVQELQAQIEEVLAECKTVTQEVRPVVSESFGPEAARLPVVFPAGVRVDDGGGVVCALDVVCGLEDLEALAALQ